LFIYIYCKPEAGSLYSLIVSPAAVVGKQAEVLAVVEATSARSPHTTESEGDGEPLTTPKEC
jgi:hypothetical protein